MSPPEPGQSAYVPSGSYHPSLSTPGDFFAPFDLEISSWSHLRESVDRLTDRFGSAQFRWRGQRDASWGLFSSLYRSLMSELKVVLPGEASPSDIGPAFPTEADMIVAEAKVLATARQLWRFDDMPALEIMARLQHFGGPTRLIDVTSNPYVAMWFAVEASSVHGSDESDARIFALGTRTLNASEETKFELTDENTRRFPEWHAWTSLHERQEHEWGTGRLKRVWRPPAYEQRILSQNASFLIDGLPIYSAEIQKISRRGLKEQDFFACTSLFTKVYSVDVQDEAIDPNYAPNFCFRVPAELKEPLRRQLTDHFGFSMASVYPDMMALSDFLLKRPLLDESIRTQ